MIRRNSEKTFRGWSFLALLLAVPFQGTAANDGSFLGDTLTVGSLIRTALERNPGLEAARWEWREAKSKEPQASAWGDPMLSSGLAPASLGADQIGYTLMLSQQIPFPGKKGLAGSVAREQARSAQWEVENRRLDLAVQAVELFGEYYALTRALEINGEFLELWDRRKSSAQARYRAGIGSPQDPLQAEAGRIQTRIDAARLQARLEETRARINALLHRSQDAPLPPPPGELSLSGALQGPSAAGADTAWLARHPEFQAVEARVRAARLSEDLARRSRWPDFQVSVQRNVMWPDRDMRNMVGLSLALPLQWGSRNASVSEAGARVKALEQGHRRHVDQLRADVRAYSADVAEAAQWPMLYRDTLLPVLEARVEAASTGYKTGRNDFFVLIQAEKALREARLAYHISLARYATRRARLHAVLGQTPFLENDGGQP